MVSSENRSAASTRWSLPITIVAALLAMAGCVGLDIPSADSTTGSLSTDVPTTETERPSVDEDTGEPPSTVFNTMTKHPGLEFVLVGLAYADDRSSFAAEHGIRVRDGRVLVVIKLEDGAELPDGYSLTVTSTYENQARAYVTFDDLIPLAEHPDVSFVRTPTDVQPYST